VVLVVQLLVQQIIVIVQIVVLHMVNVEAVGHVLMDSLAVEEYVVKNLIPTRDLQVVKHVAKAAVLQVVDVEMDGDLPLTTIIALTGAIFVAKKEEDHQIVVEAVEVAVIKTVNVGNGPMQVNVVKTQPICCFIVSYLVENVAEVMIKS